MYDLVIQHDSATFFEVKNVETKSQEEVQIK